MSGTVNLTSPALLTRQAEFLRHLADTIPNLANAAAYHETANTLVGVASNLQCQIDILKQAERVWDDLVMEAQERGPEYMSAYDTSEWRHGVDLSKHI